MTGNTINTKDLFLGLQEAMAKKLGAVRKQVKHAPTKGDVSERHWINWLEEYLPNRYNVDSATIIDYKGNYSDAIDLVIYDQQYTPFVFVEDGVKFIPAESVYAAFEVKQEVTRELLIYGGKKVESVRKLNRTVTQVVDKGRVKPAPQLFRIMGGYLALSNSWKESIANGKPFKNAISALTTDQQLDIGCVLEDSAFWVDYSNNTISYSTKEEALITFFLKLMDGLQKLGTVRPIDIMKYADALDSI